MTVELTGTGGKTELTLTHEAFADETARDKHRQGWEGCLERLPKALH